MRSKEAHARNTVHAEMKELFDIAVSTEAQGIIDYFTKTYLTRVLGVNQWVCTCGKQIVKSNGFGEHQLKNHVTGDAHRKAVYSSLMAQRGHGKQTNISSCFSKKTSFVPDPPSMPSPYGPNVHHYVRPVPGTPVRRPAYQPPVTSTTRVDAINLSGALPSPSLKPSLLHHFPPIWRYHPHC